MNQQDMNIIPFQLRHVIFYYTILSHIARDIFNNITTSQLPQFQLHHEAHQEARDQKQGRQRPRCKNTRDTIEKARADQIPAQSQERNSGSRISYHVCRWYCEYSERSSPLRQHSFWATLQQHVAESDGKLQQLTLFEDTPTSVRLRIWRQASYFPREVMISMSSTATSTCQNANLPITYWGCYRTQVSYRQVANKVAHAEFPF